MRSAGVAAQATLLSDEAQTNMRGAEAAGGRAIHVTTPGALCEALRDWGVGLATSGACARLGETGPARRTAVRTKTTHGGSWWQPGSVPRTPHQALEMPLPAFNELGDLPIGVYRATLAEVIAHFGHGTAQRVTITARLERIYALARRTGSVQRFIIFGSYVTAEPNPRDVGIFLVMRGGFQPRQAPPEAQLLFRHGTAQSELGASIFWVNAETSFADMEDLITGWQTRRDLPRRGIVEVVEHDAE